MSLEALALFPICMARAAPGHPGPPLVPDLNTYGERGGSIIYLKRIVRKSPDCAICAIERIGILL
tara:strand:- start:293643 stop:293837 length:195 start_codon:yes stop_codon:yes gene_type:complete